MAELPGGTQNMGDESVFEAAKLSDSLGDQDYEGSGPDEDDQQQEEFAPTIAKESPKARLERLGKKDKKDGQTLTVSSYSFTKPRTKDRNGMPIPPKETLSEGKKKYYSGKLKLSFVEDNLVEYYPNIHYFVGDDGKINYTAKVNRGGNNAITHLFKLVVAKLGKPEDEVSDFEALEFLKGKKVKIKTVSGTFQGKPWFRNDIVEILV